MQGGGCLRLSTILLSAATAGSLIIGAALAPAATPEDRLHYWDQGLELLDSGRTAAAATHFSSALQSRPRRLELVVGCLRVEEHRAHADSVFPRVLAGLTTAAANRARRFLSAQRARAAGDHAAAADSLQALTRLCLAQDDPLSAHFAALSVARCRIDDSAVADLSASREELQAGLARLPHTPRLHWTTELLLANLHFKADELAPAEETYRAILAATASGALPTLRCDATNALGGIMAKQRRLHESIAQYEDAVAQARALGDRRRLSLVLGNLGYQETHLRRFARAEEHLAEAEQTAVAGGFRRILGPIKAAQGAIFAMSGDRVEAVRRFREAVELSAAVGNQQGEIGARQRLGYELTQMGEYTEARHQFATCLDMLERSGGRFILNWVLGGLAIANHKLGYLDEAARYYRQAHAVNLEMGDRMSAAWCLNSLGAIQALEGDYRQALVTNYEALEQYEALDDVEGVGDVRASLAGIYQQLGDYSQALQESRLARDIARRMNAEELLRRASHTMASVYAATGQDRLAEENYLLVLEIARDWSDRVVEMWALNDLAGHYLETGRRDEARVQLQQALEMMGDEEYLPLRSLTLLHLARAADEPDAAVTWAEQALELARRGGLPEREWNALADLGWYRFQRGETTQAAQLLRESIALVESLRRRAGADELRRHMLGPALKPYERLIAIYADQVRDPAAAFTISERSRAQILAGRLQAARGRTDDGPERATDSEERDLAATITFLQSRLQDAALSATVRDSLRQKIDWLESEFQLLKLRWTPAEELEAAVLYPDPPRPAELQAALHADEHLLSYFLGQDTAFLFSVTRDEVRVYPLGDPQTIIAKIEFFLRLQRHAGTGRQALPAGVLLQARQELYRALIAPARPDIAPGATLVIVPDGLLHRVPFAYLHDGERLLVESGSLFTTPSLQVLGYLRQRGEHTAEKHISGVLAIGCAEAAGRVHPFSDVAVTSLPHADEEAWRLADLFGDAVILTGWAANEMEIRSGVLAGADIIHFAAHSYVDETDYRHSYLLLNRDPADGGAAPTGRNDGLLQWHEIVNLDLNASLVTLASCRSAGGVFTSGEGVTGLTQAFLHAGCRGVLATLTDVPDRNTGWVMDRFYRELSRGATAAAALRSAQLAGLQEGLNLGAAFVLIGDGSLTHDGRGGAAGRNLVLAGAGVCLLLVLLVGLGRRRKN